VRRLLGPLVGIAIAALGFAVTGNGQSRAISCPATDIPSTGAPKVAVQGTLTTIWCGYSDGFHGYELSINYYAKNTPADEIASLRKIEPHYCTGFQNKPYKLFSSSVFAYAGVSGNPKSWDDAFGYVSGLLAQTNGLAHSCTTSTTGGGSVSRAGCPGTKPVTQKSDKVTYAWRFSFSGVPTNVTLTRNSTSSGSGSGSATSFHCFYDDGSNAQARGGSGAGNVKFFPRNPPSTATFAVAITGSPREYVKGRTVSLRLSGRITRIHGSSCKPGPTTVELVDGAQDSVSVSLCGATLRYVNGRGARVSVHIG
jgi:hypothetical protein